MGSRFVPANRNPTPRFRSFFAYRILSRPRLLVKRLLRNAHDLIVPILDLVQPCRKSKASLLTRGQTRSFRNEALRPTNTVYIYSHTSPSPYPFILLHSSSGEHRCSNVYPCLNCTILPPLWKLANAFHSWEICVRRGPIVASYFHMPFNFTQSIPRFQIAENITFTL